MMLALECGQHLPNSKIDLRIVVPSYGYVGTGFHLRHFFDVRFLSVAQFSFKLALDYTVVAGVHEVSQPLLFPSVISKRDGA